MQNTARDLFQAQTELIDAKVELAVMKSTQCVLDRIDGLQRDMDNKFILLGKDIVAVKTDIVAIQTRLGMKNEIQSLIRARWVDYGFKSGWIILTSIIGIGSALLTTHFHALKNIF